MKSFLNNKLKQNFPETYDPIKWNLLGYGFYFCYKGPVFEQLNKYIEENEANNLLKDNEIIDFIYKSFFSLESYNFNVEGLVRAPDWAKTALYDWYGNTKEGVFVALETLIQMGHRFEINELRKILPKDTLVSEKQIPELKELLTQLGQIRESKTNSIKEHFKYTNHKDPEDDEEIVKTEWTDAMVYHYCTRVQKRCFGLNNSGILAWDVARFVHVIRLAYVEKLLTENECWENLKRLESIISADHFENWHEFSKSFLVGYHIWSGEFSEERLEIIQSFLTHKLTPLQFISPQYFKDSAF